jgi:molybdenum cofactor synthesis domain-containing protein
MHSQVSAILKGSSPLKLDPERPEYHRGIVTLDPKSSEVSVESTSNQGVGQRSSRLLSVKNANALICVPQGSGTIQPGASVTALLVEPHFFSAPKLASHCFHESAASLDSKGSINSEHITDVSPSKDKDNSSISSSDKATTATNQNALESTKPASPMSSGLGYESLSSLLPQPASPLAHGPTNPNPNISPAVTVSVDSEAWKQVRVALLTVSDRASQGVYADDSGPAMRDMLQKMSASVSPDGPDKDKPYPLQFTFVDSCIVPDETIQIRQKVVSWSERGDVDLILTSGGTGFGPRDLTPEAIRPLLHREAPGIAQALLNEGLRHTPLAVLSRPVSGTRLDCFICTLPGSVKAVKENIVALRPLLPRIMELVKSGKCSI